MRGAPAWVGALGRRCKLRLLSTTGQRFKVLMGCKRLPRGRQALPSGAAGWDMNFRFSYYAKVLCKHMIYIYGVDLSDYEFDVGLQRFSSFFSGRLRFRYNTRTCIF